MTGTGALTVPIAATIGRSGHNPELMLGYDSGAGNGAFGLGWGLGVPSIVRKTDKGLPRYLDKDESDVFILSGAEDLVPVLDDKGARVRTPRTVHGVAYLVQQYRPRTDGLFACIERWAEDATGISHWRVITRDNVTTIYGADASSRVAAADDPARTFAYLVSRTFDDKGNVTVYEYVGEDGAGIDLTHAHEANRSDADRGTQRYLKAIRYGGTTPYFADWSTDGNETSLPGDWHFELVFDYGDHAPDAPKPVPDRQRAVRPDPFSTYRAGFEIRTYRRCARVLLFHHFDSEAEVGRDCLVRSTEFTYSDELEPLDPANPVYTLLRSVTHAGFRRDGDGYLRRTMPPLELDYSRPQLQSDVRTLDADSVENLPGGRFQLVDLAGDGLPGVLSDGGDGGWGYKRNLGALDAVARFGPRTTVASLPVPNELGADLQLVDVDGDGRIDMASFDALGGYFSRTADGDWQPLHAFRALPRIDWSEPNARFVDLTGDGLSDLLVTDHGAIVFYPSRGVDGLGEAEVVPTGWDEERGPHVVLADGTQTVLIADMSGDGLSDLVRVRRDEVCYWPNLGYGRFGPMVAMDSPPTFADEERFDPARLHLGDVDGSGTTDVVYAGDDGVTIWFNLSGNGWSSPQQLAVFPTVDAQSFVQVTDLLGTGTACLVWSSPLPADAGAPLRYVDLVGPVKPHLLVRSRNNLGAETRLSYAPSTRFCLRDEEAGRPWATRLPFPVHVVERVESYDWIGRSRFVTRYAYHHGYFDGYEREFRGFGLVEQWDTEEHRADTAFPDAEAVNWDVTSWASPILTRTWFHTGVFAEAQAVSRVFEHEYWSEPALAPDDVEAMLLPDTVLPAGLTADEAREAHRALKGMVLRSEVYADDGTPRAVNPYTVTEQNFTVRLVQPTGVNKHAVFFTHPREVLTFQYERVPDDPRVRHELILEVDDWGNVRRSVSVAYPRRAGKAPPEPGLSVGFRDMLEHDQARLHIAATETRHTNALVEMADKRRTPLPAEKVGAEMTGIAPIANRPAITNLFRLEELDTHWSTLWDGAHDLAYEEIPGADVDGAAPAAGQPRRRIVEDERTVYRSDDLAALLPLGTIESRALHGDVYKLALTPGLLSRVLGGLAAPADLTEAGYVQLQGSDGWWQPTGRLFYSSNSGDSAAVELANARQHFFVPRRGVDPFGAVTKVDYDAYDLLPTSATDPVGNTTAAANDYRTLHPRLMTDANGNRSEAAYDALGLVVGNAMMGKTTETMGDSLAGFVADLADDVLLAHLVDPLAIPDAILGTATSRIGYDLHAYHRTRDDPAPLPPVTYTLARETHVSELAQNEQTRHHHAFVYSDGVGREVQRKVQAEAGPVVGVVGEASPRWVGSAWEIFNNKGKPVRTFEPFFTATHEFEFAREAGVGSTIFYDTAQRVVATLHADFTWEKSVVGTWRSETWDGNDTVLIADPRKDPDVGDQFERLLGGAPGAFTSWHDRRVGGALGTAEKDAAQKTAAHAATPSVVHFDALGRTCLSVADNGGGALVPTRDAYDAEGNKLAIVDGLGRRTFEYCIREPSNGGFRYLTGYDVAGNQLACNGIDSGLRRSLASVAGNVARTWDARGHVFTLRYDLLRRPTHRLVTTDGGAEVLLDRLVYGEGAADRNLCGRLFRHYDSSGVAANEGYDFKGNLAATSRRLAVEYRQSVDWSPLAALTDAAALDAAAAPLLLAEQFSASTRYDALNRPVQVVTPHSTEVRPNVLQPSYSDASLLERIDVWVRPSAAPQTLLDPTTAGLHAVTDIAYNARGQHSSISFGNGAVTTYTYDPATFRLMRLVTERPSSFASAARTVQDLGYAYDPVGNVTSVRDEADIQNVVFFQNTRVEPSTAYTYDPLYRLVEASGREHLGQVGGAPQQPGDGDTPRTGVLSPSDGNAMGTYAETYGYDAVGNLLTMLHQVSSGSWLRRYAYDEPSRIDPGEMSNRLTATSLPGDPDGGPYSATNDYDAHGNTTRMTHLPQLFWDERDRLRSTTRQVVNAGTPETTYYAYDGGGQRARRVTDRAAPQNQEPRRRAECVYLGGVEVYREFGPDGSTVTLARETLHVSAGADRVALVETRTVGNDPGLAQAIRFQYSNHLGSAVLELDEAAMVVSYEEYFPYGSSSYQAVRSQVETPKRYRYTGKERDEESGLYYHGARYYAPWLGRWTSCDPKHTLPRPFRREPKEGEPPAKSEETEPQGTRDSEIVDLYRYVQDNPVVNFDPDGKDPVSKVALTAAKALARRLFKELGRDLAKAVTKRIGREAVKRLAEDVSQKALKHALEHTGEVSEKVVHSLFKKGLGKAEIVELIKTALKKGNSAVLSEISENGKLAFVIEKEFTEQIGEKVEQKILRVVVDKEGNLVTAFPVSKLLQRISIKGIQVSAQLAAVAAVIAFYESEANAAQKDAEVRQKKAEERSSFETALEWIVPFGLAESSNIAIEPNFSAIRAHTDSAIKEIEAQLGRELSAEEKQQVGSDIYQIWVDETYKHKD